VDAETRRILCDRRLVEARQGHLIRLRRLFDGQDETDGAFLLCGVSKGGRAVVGDSPGACVDRALTALAQEAEALLDVSVFRPMAVEFDIYGVHFADKVLGAEVFDLDGAWQVRPVPWDVGQLGVPSLDTDPTWQMARGLARAFVAAGVSVPLFGLPVIASPLNVVVSLYGQSFLAAMIGHPSAARHDLGVIGDVQAGMHRWFRANVPADQLQPVVAASRTQPPGFGQLCGCTTQLVSPALYREFIAPLDQALLSVYPHGGMIHLCGTHVHHTPAWRDMSPLRAVQVNDRAAEDVETYFAELRAGQVLYVNPCEGMPLDRIMAITGGKRVVIVVSKTPPQLRRVGPSYAQTDGHQRAGP